MLSGCRVAGILLVVLGAASPSVLAQKTVRLSSTSGAFRTFYKNFASAVNKGQLEQVASMTSFPFKYGFDAGDEGVWTKKEFIGKAGGFLMPQPLIFKRRDPEFTSWNGVYTLTNGDDASYYTFKKKRGVYKWVSYIVEP